MVHVRLCYYGSISLVEMLGNYDSKKYCEMILEKVIPLCNDIYGKNKFIWQQDNASILNSNYTRQFFRNHKIDLLKWPSNSPDLNPVENYFSYLENIIYDNGRNFRSKDELWKSLDKAFQKTPIEFVMKLIDSMRKKMIEVCMSAGKLIKY